MSTLSLSRFQPLLLQALAFCAAALCLGVRTPAFGLEEVPPLPSLPDTPAAPRRPAAPRIPALHSATDRVTFDGDNVVEAGETVRRNVIAIRGNNYVNGTVGRDVVTNMGSAVINGTVGRDVCTTGGDVTLGPTAVVGRNVVCIGGVIHRSPDAVVRGKILTQRIGAGGEFGEWLGRSGWKQLFSHNGLPSNLDDLRERFPRLRSWVLAPAIASLVLCMLLALLFPGEVRRCGDLLAERPGLVLLLGLLMPLALPAAAVILFCTGVGIPLAIFGLPIVVIACAIFGKTAVYAVAGRGISSGRLHSAPAVLLAGILAIALFLAAPVAGLAVWLLVCAIGLGCVAARLLTAFRRAPVAAAPSAPPSPAPPPAPEPPAAEAPPLFAPALAAAVPEPGISGELPRAGFWIRMAALFIDSVIVGSAVGFGTDFRFGSAAEQVYPGGSWPVHWQVGHPFSLFALAVYGAILWKLRGATIGGIIFRLKVVRADGKPMNWETAIVRALGCFLSCFLWLGFIWIAFDDEKQAWHDRIAGTWVVRSK